MSVGWLDGLSLFPKSAEDNTSMLLSEYLFVEEISLSIFNFIGLKDSATGDNDGPT